MSMLVVGVTASAILFAVDSRQYPSGEDTVRKLFLVGKRGLLGHSGIGVIPSDKPQDQGVWDAAREVGRIAGHVAAGFPNDQFGAISKEVLTSLNIGLGKRSLLIEGQHPRLFIMFVDRDAGGRVFLARKAFNVISEHVGSGWKHRAQEGETQIILDRLRSDRGLWWDVPPECPVGNRKPTAPTPAAFAAFINDVAGQSPLCAKMIGGPIKVATIDNIGSRWLQE